MVGNHIEEQQYSREPGDILHLGTSKFSSLVLTLRLWVYTEHGAREFANLERHWVTRGRNNYGFGSLRRRRTDNGTGNLPWDWVNVISKEPSIS